MTKNIENNLHYSEILEQLKTYFPVPTSNPIMDGYFVHTISNFLDYVDNLKSAAPVLGVGQEQQADFQLDDHFPEQMRSVEAITKLLVDYCQGMTIWAHPNAQANVLPPPTIPSITAAIAAAIYNPNIIWDEYSARFAEAELQVVAWLSNLIGYDSTQSGGFFTFGGTGTILYGCKLGIEKLSNGQTMRDGIREDLKIVASAVGHYSRLNVAGWLGLGTKNLVTIPATDRSQMSLPHLETYLRQAFATGEKVAVILVTLGTTDAFGIDPIAEIVQLRDRLVQEYHVEHPPHIHADAVIGWVWSVFKDYDFDRNSLGFHPRTLNSLRDALKSIADLDLADSIGIDFHKTGYAPYVSSVFLVNDRQQLGLLSRAPEQMPYLYQFGHYHPGIYTLECSRSGGSALAALANIQLLGKQGYRALIGHIVEMAEMLRDQLEQYACIAVLNDSNYGPVTLFRVYPQETDAAILLHQELTNPDYRLQLEENNRYNRRIFDYVHDRAMRGEGVLLSWTDAYQQAHYPNAPAVAALKSFIMSPWTDLQAISMVVQQVLEARSTLRGR
ncbi:MAG TPA: pyridoxal-dependent decarboxylase [Microcoleaceae cyanobacterium]|jgi:glutamate/tyrosine decarboxylase-like PLP-dependent enzyme